MTIIQSTEHVGGAEGPPPRNKDDRDEIVVLTHFASPYQIELFDEVARTLGDGFSVYYLHQTDRSRSWIAGKPKHRAFFLDEGEDVLFHARSGFVRARLAIVNFYAERPAADLMRRRAASGLPWVFWGERPGSLRPYWAGRWTRFWRLRALRRSGAPIWGIGRFAVEGYKREFGARRSYGNLPYFSDLDRFARHKGTGPKMDGTVFLFSGALISRKGVDLLARAFLRLAREMPQVRLRILGEGALRESVRQTLAVVEDRVDFLGFKDWADLPATYASADFLCAPSRYDGWGMIVPEGLAAGLPVIGTDRTGAALEFVESGRNGWLIPAGDGEALFNAMSEAATSPPTRRTAISEAARATVRNHGVKYGAARFLAAAREAVAGWSR